MDYEKKYKEANNKVVARFGINVAKEIFTDLYESEDERIKKEIIDFICWATDRGCITKEQRERSNSWLAWLENIPYTIDHEKREGFHLGYKAALEKQRTSYTKRDVDDAYVEGMAFAKDELEKQGEQPKEATYTHEAETGNGNIKALVTEKVQLPMFKVKYAGSEYNVLTIKDIAGVTFYGIEDEPNHIDYVKAENCEIISGYAIKENGSPYPTKPAVFSEQKPACSEEDEKKLLLLEALCDDQINGSTPHSTMYREMHELKEWLKSLKPQNLWKPSEEQIVVLELASKYERVFTPKQIDILIGLKEQLKKLKA